MAEHFITFSDAMVRAILAGRKTQTRRLIRAPSGFRISCYTEGGKVVGVFAVDEDGDPADVEIRCPYGIPGDHLLVREGVAHAGGDLSVYTADGAPTKADCWPWKVKRLAPRFCPRGLVRLKLEVASIRAEWLQAITAADILAEGAVERSHYMPELGKCPVSAFDGACYPDLLSLWRAGWDSINGKRAPCAGNPLVWVVEFRRVP